MLFQGEPVIRLRAGGLRTAFDSVWMEQLDLSGLKALPVLREYLQALPPESKAGIIQSHLRLPNAQVLALKQLSRLVISRLDALKLMPVGQVDAFHERALLMSMRGAQPHTDIGASKWQNSLFWSLCLRDTDTHVLFGNLKLRFPQQAGTLLIFDPAQSHCVLDATQDVFMKSHFRKDRTQIFAGGDFEPRSWRALGVEHNIPWEDLPARVDARMALVHQKTCLFKR